ncbi:MAG TPA: Rieske 2Fe-2S domain-containing protein [Micromonosporaceae bacterium]|nr:Rieske 2Fe-2S domain-containing protein [Micromonosporaceae bacterium]
MPTLTFLGHAGLGVRADNFRLLADPWFARTGAFLGSWHQFPRNDHLDAPETFDVDWVAVSHEHLDHLDASVLGRLPDRARVLVPRYPAPTVVRRLRAAGARRIVELTPWEPYPLDTSGSWITVIPESSPMCHDAAMLIVADGHAVLNCNDARLTAAQARRAKHLAGGRLDVMAVQTSGASWHPICYAYPPEVRHQIERDKRIGKFRAVQRLVRATGPELAVPFAGPACFLDPELARFNPTPEEPGIFPDSEQAVAWLSEHLPAQRWAAFRPGDTIDLATGEVTPDPVSAAFSYTQGIEDYLARYAADRREAIASVHAAAGEPGPDLPNLFRTHFGRLGTLSPYFLSRIGMTVRFEVTGAYGGTWDVRMDTAGLTVDLTGGTAAPEYTFTVEGRWLQAVLRGDIAWEDLLLSLRLRARRDPDRYNDYLIGLLKHANEPALRAIEEYETTRDADERIVVRAGDTAYEIGRYCPHAGEDLAVGAVVTGGVLRCLGHNFEFDLRTGVCVNARCEPLFSKQVAGAAAAPAPRPGHDLAAAADLESEEVPDGVDEHRERSR